MKVPKAWANGKAPTSLTAFQLDAHNLVPKPAARLVSKVEPTKTKIVARGDTLIEQPGTKIEADGDVARWWVEMSPESKKEYVAEHPNSKYADMHRKETGESPAPKTDNEVKPAGPAKEQPAPKPQPKKHGPGHKGHAPAQKPKAPSQQPPASAEHEKVGTPDKASVLKSLHDDPHMQPNSPERKGAVGFLRKKTGHIISHLKKDAKEWKVAGVAMKKLATRQPLDHADKHAMGAVAADIAAVTVSLALTGGAAHGIVAFLQHFGTHMAQEAMLKAAIKGAAGAAAHASVKVLSSDPEEDRVMQNVIKEMMDMLEHGDLEELARKFEAEAQKEGKGGEAKKEMREASVTATTFNDAIRGLRKDFVEVSAKLDMSAEVAGAGNCPECKKPMTIALVSATGADGDEAPSYACSACRISIPIPDDHDYFNSNAPEKEGQAQVG